MNEDENLSPDSSTGDAGLTADDLDFGAYNERYTAERLGKPTGDKPLKAEASEPTKAADPAPAKGEAPVTERADEPKQPAYKPPTAEDIRAAVRAELEASKPKEAPKEDPYPKLSDPQYQTVEDHEKAVADWTKRQMASAKAEWEAEQNAKQTTSREQERQVAAAKADWESRETAAAERMKARGVDYAAVKAKANTMPFHEEGLQFILDSPVGPEMIEYFTNHPDEWSEVIAMRPSRLEARMDNIERELKRGQTTAPPARQAGKTVSSAKEPPKMLGGKQAPVGDPRERDNSTPDDETGFAAHFQNFTRDRMRNTKGQFVGQ